MNGFVAFSHPGHLLAALHYLLHPGAPFPREVLETKDSRWVLPLDSLSDRETFEHLQRQHAWDVEHLGGTPKGRSVQLADLVARSRWVSWNPLAKASGGSSEPVTAAGRRVILAAKDEAQAGRVLAALTDCLALGIQAHAVKWDAAGSAPFRYFWEVRLESDDLASADYASIERAQSNLQMVQPACHAAERAWWGPACRGGFQARSYIEPAEPAGRRTVEQETAGEASFTCSPARLLCRQSRRCISSFRGTFRCLPPALSV